MTYTGTRGWADTRHGITRACGPERPVLRSGNARALRNSGLNSRRPPRPVRLAPFQFKAHLAHLARFLRKGWITFLVRRHHASPSSPATPSRALRFDTDPSQLRRCYAGGAVAWGARAMKMTSLVAGLIACLGFCGAASAELLPIGNPFWNSIGNVALSPDGGTLFAGTGNASPNGHGLDGFDVSTPASPVFRGHADAFANFTGLNVNATGTHAYLSSFTFGYYDFDVQNHSSPTIASFKAGNANGGAGQAYQSAQSPNGALLYLANGSEGFQIFDTSSPETFRLLATFNTRPGCSIDGAPVFGGNCDAQGVAVSRNGKTAFVTSGWGWVRHLRYL